VCRSSSCAAAAAASTHHFAISDKLGRPFHNIYKPHAQLLHDVACKSSNTWQLIIFLVCGQWRRIDLSHNCIKDLIFLGGGGRCFFGQLGWLNQMSLQHDLQQQKKKAVEQQLLLSSSNSQAPTAAARNSMMVQQQDDAASETSSHTAEDRHLHEEAAERVDDHNAPDHEPSEDHTPLQQLSVLIPHNIIHEEQLPLQPAAANDQPASSSYTTAAAAAAAGFGSPLPLLQLQHFGPTTSLNAAVATTTRASGYLESSIKADAAAMESTQDKFK
jgi:hypothetical protein